MAFEEMSRATGQQGPSSHLQTGAARADCDSAPVPGSLGAALPPAQAALRWLAPGGSQRHPWAGGGVVDS